MFESAKVSFISFSKCWFHECKVNILDKYMIFDHLSLLQQSAYTWFQQSSSGLSNSYTVI